MEQQSNKQQQDQYTTSDMSAAAAAVVCPVVEAQTSISKMTPTRCGAIFSKISSALKGSFEVEDAYYTATGMMIYMVDVNNGQKYTIEITPT